MSSWHEARVEQQLREANASLRDINDHLWEVDQPAEVRAALQAGRAERNRVTRFGVRAVAAVVGTWIAASLLFGAAGQHAVGRVLEFAWDGLGALLVVGFYVAIGAGLFRGVRAFVRRPDPGTSPGERGGVQ